MTVIFGAQQETRVWAVLALLERHDAFKVAASLMTGGALMLAGVAVAQFGVKLFRYS